MTTLVDGSYAIQKDVVGDANIPDGTYTAARFDVSALFGGSTLTDAIAINTAPHVTHVSKSVFIQDVQVDGDLVCNGAPPSPFWIAGRINGLGDNSGQKGKYVFTSTKVSTMIYDITFPSHPDGSNYTVLLGSTEYHVLYRSETPTSLRIYAVNNSNAFVQQGGGVVSVAILI